MALKHMSVKNAGELTTAKEVAEAYHAPFDATARVMQIMAQHGLLKSEQGAFGGYALSRALNEVSMEDLISMIQGPTKLAKCMNDEEPCEIQKSCNIISPIHHLNKKLNHFYRNLTVSELLSN